MLNKEINFDNFKDEVSPGIFRKFRYAFWLLISNVFFQSDDSSINLNCSYSFKYLINCNEIFNIY